MKRNCDNCGKIYEVHGWAFRHGMGLYCSKSCSNYARPVVPPISRFFSFVQLNIKTQCWLWLGEVNNWGYAMFSMHNGHVPGYQWAYEYFIGPIPEGKTPDHLCRVRSCVNPTHLEPVAKKVNILRGTSCGAINARKTLCIRGHTFDGKDPKTGFRYCKTCKKLKRQELADSQASEIEGAGARR